MARRIAVDEQINHERWLVSYADFMTLLLAFFVVMYSISQVNESKYRVLSNTLTAAFNQPERALDPLQVGHLSKSNPLNLIEMASTNTDDKEGEGIDAEEGKASRELTQISDQFDQVFNDLIDKKLVSIKGNEEWLELELNASLLFDSGAAVLGADAEIILNEIAQILFDHNKPVRVEGFTDNVPINTPQFPSNWELSAARAAAVVQLFVESGLDPGKLAAVGYGEHQPKADNSTQEGRAANRRVVLMISRYDTLRPDIPDPVDEQAVQTAVTGKELAAESVDAANSASAPQASGLDSSEEKAIDGIKTVKLKTGGLLFTSGDRKVENAEEKTQE